MSEYYDFPRIMIDDTEYWQILEVKNLKKNAGVSVRLGDEIEYEVAIFYVNDEVFGLSNICPHRHQNKIHQGYIKDGTVICPLHHWTFDLRTGENVNKLQGLKPIQVFDVRIINDFVYIKKPEIPLPKWRQTED